MQFEIEKTNYLFLRHLNSISRNFQRVTAKINLGQQEYNSRCWVAARLQFTLLSGNNDSTIASHTTVIPTNGVDVVLSVENMQIKAKHL